MASVVTIQPLMIVFWASVSRVMTGVLPVNVVSNVFSVCSSVRSVDGFMLKVCVSTYMNRFWVIGLTARVPNAAIRVCSAARFPL